MNPGPERIGVEIELLAPKGGSRKILADAIAERFGGRVRRFFHPQGEHSKAVNTAFFENLTLGFAIENDAGDILAQCVDDFTLQDDLDKRHPPLPGWYRIVSDDARFLRLLMRHADAREPLETVLDPIARLFGVSAEFGEGGMIRIADDTGAPIVLAAPLPGERERPCELVTRPIETDHLGELETLLGLAKSLDFTIPAEAATHIHFDGAPLCDAATLANLIRYLARHGEALKAQFGVNPRCRRLGGWSPELIRLADSPEFAALDWDRAKDLLRQVKLTKFCDFNLRNLVYRTEGKHTFEVRIFPVSLEAGTVVDAAARFSAILRWAADHGGKLKPVPERAGAVS